MYQPSLKMQTAKQQFEPQRAGWKSIIYNCVFATGITLNHTRSLHLLGMLSDWDPNKSTRGVLSLFFVCVCANILCFRNLGPKEKELPAQIQMPHLYLDLRQRRAGELRCESMACGSWEGRLKIFPPPFVFRKPQSITHL